MSALSQFATNESVGGHSGLYQRRMESIFGLGLAIRPSEERPLKSQVLAYCGSRLQFASLRLSPHSAFHAHRSSAATPRFLLTVNKEGPTLVAQDGRETRVGPNEMFLIDPGRAFHIESGNILTHSVYIPTASLRALVPQIDAFTAMRLECRAGAGAILRMAVDEMIRSAADLDEAEADLMADLLPQLVAAAFSGLTRSSPCPPSRQRLLHKQRVRRFARENLADPTLSADSIAQGANVSLRYLYELFADEDQALMKWIWSERLARCRGDLETPALSHRSISEIAYSWGFNSLAHFSRRFSERYSLSPRAFRARALGAIARTDDQVAEPA